MLLIRLCFSFTSMGIQLQVIIGGQITDVIRLSRFTCVSEAQTLIITTTTLGAEYSNSLWMPCAFEVVDTMPYAQDQTADIPCTGILRGYNDPAKVLGDTSGASGTWFFFFHLLLPKSILLSWTDTELSRRLGLGNDCIPDESNPAGYRSRTSRHFCGLFSQDNQHRPVQDFWA